MTDKNARNVENTLEVLADDIERYELLSAKEIENVLREVEGRHSELPIEIESGETSNQYIKKFIGLTLKRNCLVFSSFLSTVRLDAEEITKSSVFGVKILFSLLLE